jgi:hypothetical protein
VLDEFRGKPCLICRAPSDPAHIKSWGSGGKDERENLLSLCRHHHSESHQVGWLVFCQKYPKVLWELQKKGWGFVDVFGILKLKKKE